MTWSNIPDSDGRRIFLAWMSNWQYANVVPTESWRSAMTIPRTLQLRQTNSGLRLASLPVKELANIRKETNDLGLRQVSGENTFPEITCDQSASEILLEFNFSNENTNAGLRLSNAKGEKITVGFEANQNRFYIDRTESGSANFSKEFSGIHYAPRMSTASTVKLHVLVDVTSVELFADGGTSVITDSFQATCWTK